MRLAAGVVALVVCVHAGLWALLRDESRAPDIGGPLASLSYQPYRGSLHPKLGNRPTRAEIKSDLKVIAPLTQTVRTYSSICGQELIPDVANEFDLRVTVGAWIEKSKKDKDKDKKRRCLDAEEKRNDREVRAAVDLAKKNRKVNALVTGNEGIFRQELEPSDEALDPEKQRELQRAVSKAQAGDEDKSQVADEDLLSAEELARVEKAGTDKEALRKVKEEIGVARLIEIIKRAKRESPVPVTTAEVWNVWRDYPDLVSAVDFIA